MSIGNGYAGCLRSKQCPILQGLVGSLETQGFTLRAKEAMTDFNQKRDVIQLFLKRFVWLHIENGLLEDNGSDRKNS